MTRAGARRSHMIRSIVLSIVVFFASGIVRAEPAPPPPASDFAQQLYDRVRPSLVAVQYTFDTELGRHELTFAGVVVRDDGLVLFPLAAVDERFPNEQLTDFKVIVPQDNADPLELDAIFQGRDERSRVAFVKPKDARKWTPI